MARVGARVRQVAAGLALAAALAGCAPAPASPAAPTSAPAPAGTGAAATTATRPAVPSAGPDHIVAAPSSVPSPAAGATGSLTTVRVVQNNLVPNKLGEWVARDAGIFAQNGLRVETSVATGTTAIATLLSGQADIAETGGSEAISAAAGGADLAILANVAPVYSFLLEARPEIHSVADLKGKKIGITTPGAEYDVATRLVLEQYHLDPDKDVTLVPTGSVPNVQAALASGAVQAGMSQLPASMGLEKQGLHPLVDMAKLKVPASTTTIVVQRTWLQAHRDVAQRYVDAVVQGIARARQDKALGVKALQENLKVNDQAQLEATYSYFIQEVIPAQPFPRAEQFTGSVGVLAKKNPKVKNVNLGSLLDPSFVQRAVSQAPATPQRGGY